MAKAGIEQSQAVIGRLELELLPELGEVGRLTKAFEAFGLSHRFSPKTIYEVTLALDELVTNIINHGLKARDNERIRVDIRYAGAAPGGTLTIVLSDPGHPFDPREVSAPGERQSLDDHPIGGLGIHLVRQMTDALDYCRERGWNHLTLTKHIGAAAE